MTVGYGFSAGGDYSQSKIRADHASVTEQSGIYAGEDGYQIKVGNHTDLKGGIITSSQSAEDKGKNRFSTGTLAGSDIQNYSQYEGKSFGLGASVSISGKTLGQGEQNHPQDSHLTSVADKNGASSSVGYGSDSDSQSSITKSGINTRNIQITDEAGQIRLTGKTAAQTKADIGTNVTTDTADQHSGRLKNVFDKDRVQSELDLQRTVSQDFSKNVQQANTEINQHLDKLKADKEAAETAAAEALADGDMETAKRKAHEAQDAAAKADNWQQGKVILNMLASGLAAPTQSGAGIAAATASPAVSYAIGQHFKDLAGQNANGKLTASQETAHVLAHAVLGAAVAAAGDNNALAGALGAGGSEAAAPYIGKWLYGKEKGSDLAAEEKETVSAITSLLGTATGAAIGDTTTNAAQGSLNAKSAVGNNWLSVKQLIEVDKTYFACATDEICKQRVVDEARILSQAQDTRLTWAKVKCTAGYCDELTAMNKQWVYSIGINNVVAELRKHYPNATHQQLIQAAQVYATEADSSFNQGTTRFIVGALNDFPALGLAGRQISTGIRGISRLIKRVNPNIRIEGQKYYVPLPTLNPKRVTVYRIEGTPNTRLLISDTGMVQIQGNTTLYLNFGNRQRAIQYLEQKVRQNLPDVQVKTFTVPKSVVDDLNKIALPENKVKTYDPNRLRPVIADPTKATNQFGIRPHDFRNFENQIIKGSGKNGR